MRPFLLPSAVLVALWLGAAPALAQSSRPERPYRGLFASGTSETGQSLSASASLAVGYDNNLLADAVSGGAGGNAPIGRSHAGGLAQGSAGLSYSWQTLPFAFGASVGTSARYYPTFETEFIQASQGQLFLATTIRDRLSMAANASVADRPYLFNSLFTPPDPLAGEVPAPDLDLVVAERRLYTSFGGTLGYTHPLSRRTSLNAAYAYRQAYPGDDAGRFYQHSTRVGLQHGLSRGLNLRLGYGYRSATYPSGQTVDNHSINAGVDYGRAISLTRRTTLSLNTGSTAAQRDERLQFRLTGAAMLTHEIGRTWSAWIAYNRDAQFLETWEEPLFADAVTLGLRGLVTRRLRFAALARGALGTIGNRQNPPGFNNYHATASLGLAINRYVNAMAAYAYYYHRLPENLQLPFAIEPEVGRHSVRVGVVMWLPIFQRIGGN